MCIRGFRFAADCLNDRNRLCDAAGIARRRSSFPRCERTQQDLDTSALGSKQTLAALRTNVRNADQADLCDLRTNGRLFYAALAAKPSTGGKRTFATLCTEVCFAGRVRLRLYLRKNLVLQSVQRQGSERCKRHHPKSVRLRKTKSRNMLSAPHPSATARSIAAPK